ncbi:MAG: prepilin peptidase [Leptolyngbyaceae cyanobacterium]
MIPAFSIITFILGAAVGSFLNVVVYRLPAGQSPVYPPSRCPKCQHRLRPHENVPVLGWLWLKGRCAHCRQSISMRYPIVEAATGLLFLLVFWQFGFSGLTIAGWLLLSWLLALALIDLDTLTLPNSLTQSGLVLGLVFQFLLGGVSIGWFGGAITQLVSGIFGAVLGLWLVDTIILLGSLALGQTAMGGGDAKLAAMIGAWLGWKLLLLTGFLACLLGAIVGGVAMALGRLSRHQPLPFGPFLAAGAAIAALWGQAMLSTYWQTFSP